MAETRTVATSYEVWQWPEWKALAARLGINECHTTRVSVTLEIDRAVLIQSEYCGTKNHEPT